MSLREDILLGKGAQFRSEGKAPLWTQCPDLRMPETQAQRGMESRGMNVLCEQERYVRESLVLGAAPAANTVVIFEVPVTSWILTLCLLS